MFKKAKTSRLNVDLEKEIYDRIHFFVKHEKYLKNGEKTISSFVRNCTLVSLEKNIFVEDTNYWNVSWVDDIQIIKCVCSYLGNNNLSAIKEEFTTISCTSAKNIIVDLSVIEHLGTLIKKWLKDNSHTNFFYFGNSRIGNIFSENTKLVEELPKSQDFKREKKNYLRIEKIISKINKCELCKLIPNKRNTEGLCKTILSKDVPCCSECVTADSVDYFFCVDSMKYPCTRLSSRISNTFVISTVLDHFSQKIRFVGSISIDSANYNEDFVDKFTNFHKEIKKLRYQNPPYLNFPLALDIYNHNELYFISEVPDGILLHDLLEAHWNDIKDISTKIFKQLTIAIAFLHKQKFTYRNLSPKNIHIDFNGDLKLSHFYFLKKWEENSFDVLNVLENKDLPTYLSYSSPEFMNATKTTLSFKESLLSDVWALGVIGYQLFSGKPSPFAKENLIETIDSIKKVDSYSLIKTIDAPEQIKKILIQCLQKEPDKRLQSAEEILTKISSGENK